MVNEKVYKTIVKPAMMYASETWAVKKSIYGRNEGVEAMLIRSEFFLMLCVLLVCKAATQSGPRKGRDKDIPVSRFECVSGLSVYWPIIALGTRECGVAKLCRDPTVQSEFFLRVSLLKTLN